MEKKGNGPKGFILGGLIIILSTLESETMIPWYVKVVGGIGLIIIGVNLLITRRDG